MPFYKLAMTVVTRLNSAWDKVNKSNSDGGLIWWYLLDDASNGNIQQPRKNQ